MASTHVTNIADLEDTLAKGIDPSEEALQKAANIIFEEAPTEIIRYHSNGGHHVFLLKEVPTLIFKISISEEDPMTARYKKIIFAASAIARLGISLLVIPHTRLYKIETTRGPLSILVEEKLDLEDDPNVQAALYHEQSDSIRETVLQLAQFILSTGFSDVDFRNIPLLKKGPPYKIGLIDLEEMDGASFGIYGTGAFRRGLIRCTTPSTGRKIHKLAEKMNVTPSLESYNKIKSLRKHELERASDIKKFYETNHIIVGDELIKNETTETKDITDAINQAILVSKETLLANRRSVEVMIPFSANRKQLFAQYEKKLKKLKSKGIIFDFALLPGEGYRIQA